MKYCWILCFLISCAYLEKAQEISETSPKIAQVKDAILYQKDIEGLVPPNTKKEDSTQIIDRFVEAWIRKQLLYLEAQAKLSSETENIERQVQDYRHQLLLYAYQKQYIDQEMDTLVLEKQIQEYYEQFPESFILNNAIFKGIFIKINKNSNRLSELQNLLASESQDDLGKLKSDAVLNAAQYSLESEKWVDLQPVLSDSPFAEALAKHHISKGIRQAQDQDFIYLLKIKQIKYAGEQAPLDFSQNMIRDIILSKRKVELQKQLEESIFDKATQNKDYEIFRN